MIVAIGDVRVIVRSLNGDNFPPTPSDNFALRSMLLSSSPVVPRQNGKAFPVWRVGTLVSLCFSQLRAEF